MFTAELLLIANAGATFFMTGLIWLVQVVHYPLLAGVGGDQFPTYQRRHCERITWIVAPAMLIEAAAAAALCLLPPAAVPAWMCWTGAAAVAVIWTTTATQQAPCHQRLLLGFDPATHRRLVRSNWLRTILWSLRAALAASMLWLALQHPAGSAPI